MKHATKRAVAMVLVASLCVWASGCATFWQDVDPEKLAALLAIAKETANSALLLYAQWQEMQPEEQDNPDILDRLIALLETAIEARQELIAARGDDASADEVLTNLKTRLASAKTRLDALE